MRSTSRICRVSFDAVAKLLVDMAEACQKFSDATLIGVQAKRLQIDELWAFCRVKDRNANPDAEAVEGSIWTHVAIDADTKLALSWMVGLRDRETMRLFVNDLAARVAGRPQITSDGWHAYPAAINAAFGRNVDYAVLIKRFGGPADAPDRTQARYSPPPVIGITKHRMFGNPDLAHVSTSYVERSNLSMRMGCRRLTRLTNAFSKKIENHIAAQAIYFMHYNFVRPHAAFKAKGEPPRTPAMAAGLADHVWTLEELVGLLAASEPKAKRVWSHKRAAQQPSS